MNPGWKRIIAEGAPRSDSLRLAAALRLIRSPRALKLLRWVAPYNRRLPAPHRPGTAFALDLVRRLYAEGQEPVVWASIFTPAELLWGLGVTPFYPEMAASAADGLGLTARVLAKASEAACPADLCTYHRSALGLSRDGFSLRPPRVCPPPACAGWRAACSRPRPTAAANPST